MAAPSAAHNVMGRVMHAAPLYTTSVLILSLLLIILTVNTKLPTKENNIHLKSRCMHVTRPDCEH